MLLHFVFLLMTAAWSGKWIILAKRTSIKALRTTNNTEHLRILSGCFFGVLVLRLESNLHVYFCLNFYFNRFLKFIN